MPQIGLLRPASSLKFSVLNSNKETVRVLGEEYNVRRQTFVDYNKAVTKGNYLRLDHSLQDYGMEKYMIKDRTIKINR